MIMCLLASFYCASNHFSKKLQTQQTSLTLAFHCVYAEVFRPSCLSEETTGGLAVQRQLAGAVAGHAHPHESQQERQAGHHGTIPALQDSLGRLGLERESRWVTLKHYSWAGHNFPSDISRYFIFDHTFFFRCVYKKIHYLNPTSKGLEETTQ